MESPRNYEGKPHSEVVYFKQSRTSERQDRHANQLGECYTGQYRRANVNQRGPHALISFPLTSGMIHRQSRSGAHERTRNMRTELDRDSKRNDEVDKTDRVQANAPDGHYAHDGHHRERDDAGHYCPGPP